MRICGNIGLLCLALASATAAASDGAWLRVGVGYAPSSYGYSQTPTADPSPLLAEAFAFRGPVGGKAAWPQGFEAHARFWVPGLPYLGVRAVFRQAFYQVTTSRDQTFPQSLQVLDGSLMARVPIRVGSALLHAGARGGVYVDDFLYLLDGGDGSATPATLRVVRPSVGGELGVEIGGVWAVAGATARPFQPEQTATGLTVDLSGGYEIIPMLTIDAGVALVLRSAPVISATTGRAHAHLADEQIIARVGVGLALGSLRDASDQPPRLLVTVAHDGKLEAQIPVTITDGARTWEITSDTRPVGVELPPGSYEVHARGGGRDAVQQVVVKQRDVELRLDLKMRVKGSLSASYRHADDAPLDHVTFLLRGDDGYAASDTLGPWGLSPLDVPGGRYHLFLWATDGALYHESIEIGARRTVHVDAILRPSPITIDDSRLKLGERIRFEPGTATLRAESAPTLAAVAAMLHANPQIARIEIQSHTDSEGVAASDIILTQERADWVRAHLVDLGIDPKRLTAVGYGPRFPTATNSTEEGRAANRRVEFLILETDDP